MLCLDRQTDQITVSGHYIGTTPCLWKTQEEGERFLVTGDDRPTTEKIHAVSIYNRVLLALYVFLVPKIKS